MNVALQPSEPALDERYRRDEGAVYLTGVQALARVLLDRARLDRQSGLDVAGYVSGYEGSPLAGYDLELQRQSALLREHGIVHRPGVNEELAATAVAGTQLARGVSGLRCDGVVGVWYGKAPGLDRATDALRHANLVGTDGRGGAVALVGDDPAAKSSSVPSASELALADLGMPTLYPADPADVLAHGRHAVELSRVSGLWTAMKVTATVADGASTASVDGQWSAPVLSAPDGAAPYGHRPSARLLGAELAELERSLQLVRLPLAVEYVRRSGLNQVVGAGRARVGVVAAGDVYLSLRQALSRLGLDDDELARRGVRLLRLGVLFPLDSETVAGFADGLDEIVVVEDKRAFVEDAVKAVLYGRAGAPPVYGKRTRDGSTLFAPTGHLDADAIASGLARHLEPFGIPEVEAWRRRPVRERRSLPLAPRTPYFCSGCPHNSSTKAGSDTLVGGGIGCHAMVLFMPQEQVGRVTGLTQMGGEGAHWIGMAPFVTETHFVQNLGDGTFAHSGSLAVRAAVAAGVNVTFKLLRNSAVAMTGGQQAVGELPLDRLVTSLVSEGVQKVVVVSDDPATARRLVRRQAEVRHRDDLPDVVNDLSAVAGVTVVIHDQECAAEKRRKRRRGKAAAPDRRVVVNERVCEGCGDCGVASNCLSVEPVQTEFGRKTRINQASCNVDLSCLAGDCPSFVTVTPGTVSKRQVAPEPPPAEPVRVADPARFTLRITGVGGTGVVTLSQVLATAAAAEGHSVRVLDQTGLAQKGGAVVSDLAVSTAPWARSPQLAAGECDLYLGCDSLVATDPANLRAADPSRTVAVVSTTQVPTGRMVVDTAATFPPDDEITSAVRARTGRAVFLDAAAEARRLLGDTQYANVLLLGAAYQTGAVPVDADAIERAIGLNGVAVDANLAAFRRGRALVAGSSVEEDSAAEPRDVDETVAIRVGELTRYQDAAYTSAYQEIVGRVRTREREVVAGTRLTAAVAENLFKLMAYKDEYEVARLCLDPELPTRIRDEFGDGARYRYQLHPPVLRALGMKRKLALGPWVRPVFRVLYGMRGVRGRWFDPFGHTEVRRVERALVAEYRQLVNDLVAGLTPDNHARAVEIAELPDLVRGYEHVKLGNVTTYRARLAELVEGYR